MVKKIGFWAVISIVFGSQIGSGIFILPSALSSYGNFGLYGWCVAGSGAILLAIVFAELCSRFPKTGGPYAYVKIAFGSKLGFFVGWAYWLVSWISNTVLIVSSISYLTPFIGTGSPLFYFAQEMILLVVLMWINCRGVEFSGTMEFILSVIKLATFVIVPCLLLPEFDTTNISISEQYATLPTVKLIDLVTVFCFWGFIGLECATTPAESVKNPSKTIPAAIILGTICVVLVYLLNTAAIMGVMPRELLEVSTAPFVDAINIVIGKNTSLLMSLIAAIVCIGTLNAWILSSAQISLGLANDGLMPKMFGEKNAKGAPQNSVLICGIGMIPILLMTMDATLSAQISLIVDFSVKACVIVYMFCCVALLKILWKEKKFLRMIIPCFALLFCVQIMMDASLKSLIISALFFVSGIFMLPFVKKN